MLSTCQVMQCEDISHCKLKDGFIDLCQKPAQFLAEIRLKTDQIWEQKQIVQSVIFAKVKANPTTGDKIKFLTLTPNGIPVPFEIDPVRQPTPKPDNQPPLNIALTRISRLRAAKTAKTNKQTTRQKLMADFMAKNGFIPIEPKPEPTRPEKWIPERENAYERNIIQGLTDIEDRCVYRPIEEGDKEFIPDVTKSDQEMKDRRKWEKKLIRFHDAQDTKLRNLQNMGY